MNGQNITNIATIGSMYDMDSLSVYADNKMYRMKASEVLAMFNEFTFKKVKKREYTYLEVLI